MKIELSNHLKKKLRVLAEHGVVITSKQIEDVVKNPEKILEGKYKRFIAQKSLDNEHMLRVVFEKNNGNVKIITVYPARRERYESKL